jgi:hypothetical protein
MKIDKATAVKDVPSTNRRPWEARNDETLQEPTRRSRRQAEELNDLNQTLESLIGPPQ